MKKWILFISFCLVSLYAPVELYRVITIYETQWGAVENFGIEKAFIIGCYIIMMVLFNLIVWTKSED